MKVSCNEGLASHVGPESCGNDRKIVVEALTGESAGRVLSLENFMLWSADVVLTGGRQHLGRRAKSAHRTGAGEWANGVDDPRHRRAADELQFGAPEHLSICWNR